MKENELRIGNLVYAFKTVWSVDNTCFSNIELIKTYRPIPLTEEWLIRFGFFKVKDIEGFSIWGFPDIMFTYETERNFVMLDRKIISHCKYVHQLQNLYFALTGEELNVK